MSAQDNIEKILRSLHVMLSKSEKYAREPSKVIVDKQQMLDLLSDLNKSIYDIMDEYELTERSRDRAEREFRKKGDKIIWDASRKAEDIYAASMMYSEEALNSVQDILNEATESVQGIYEEMNRKLEEQEKAVRTNQLELKAQLQDLLDTEKYMKLIEDRNREIAQEKARKENKKIERKPSIYANRQTEVRVNTEYLERLGLSVPEEGRQEISQPADRRGSEDSERLMGEVENALSQAMEEEKEGKKEIEAEVQINLDADYFRWKEANLPKGDKDSGADADGIRETGDFSDLSRNMKRAWANIAAGKKSMQKKSD